MYIYARIQIKKGVTPKHKDQKGFKMTKSSYVQQDVEVGNVDVKEQKEMDMWIESMCHICFLDMWDAWLYTS